jgi:hypothetical protein
LRAAARRRWFALAEDGIGRLFVGCESQKGPGLGERVAKSEMTLRPGDDVEQIAMLSRRAIGLMCNYT